MRNKVLAIGIDAPTNQLLVDLMDSGQLPNLAGLRQSSLYGLVRHAKKYSNQNSWATFLSGVSIDNLEYWISNYYPEDYQTINNCLYNYYRHTPFYAFEGKNVIVFDLPAAISKAVKGLQIVGWASELNETYPESLPRHLIDQIHDRYGFDPKQDTALKFYNEREGKEGYSYRVPSAYDMNGLVNFKDKLLSSIDTRKNICIDLMNHNDWDLFITCFSEIHVGGHTLWHMSQDHPLNSLGHDHDRDLLLDVYQAVDSAIGALIDNVADDVSIVVFTVDSIVADCLENPRSVFLPELLYRWCFPGKAALAVGSLDAPPPAPALHYPEHWKHEIWKLRNPDNAGDLQSPLEQESLHDTFSWQPTNWYKPVWQAMKAFALPSVADGYIRLNLMGREANGVVPLEQYGAVCDEIEAMLLDARDARDGRKIVDRVIRVRRNPLDESPDESPADLVVLFSEESSTDTVDHPDLGRIGPLPFFRPGGHQKQGSVIENPFMIRPANAAISLSAQPGRLEDVPATIAALLGCSLAADTDGRSLLAGMDR